QRAQAFAERSTSHRCSVSAAATEDLAARSASWHPVAMAGPALIDNERRAQQKARAIASDIYLYNKSKIAEALLNGTFFEIEELTQLITEGRDLFRQGVTPEMFKRNFYDRAIVDRVIKPMAGLKTPIW